MEEETGLSRSQVELYTLVEDEPGVPLDIDSHFIPENPVKEELSHYHHDYRYLFFTTSEEVEIDESESNKFIWSEFDDFKNDSNFTVAARKIEKIIS